MQTTQTTADTDRTKHRLPNPANEAIIGTMVRADQIQVGDIVAEHGQLFWVASHARVDHGFSDHDTLRYRYHVVAVGDLTIPGYFHPGSDWTLQGSKWRSWHVVNRPARVAS